MSLKRLREIEQAITDRFDIDSFRSDKGYHFTHLSGFCDTGYISVSMNTLNHSTGLIMIPHGVHENDECTDLVKEMITGYNINLEIY